LKGGESPERPASTARVVSWPSSDDLQRQAAEAVAARERARQEREAEETRKAVAEARFEVCGMLNPVAVDVLPERAQICLRDRCFERGRLRPDQDSGKREAAAAPSGPCSGSGRGWDRTSDPSRVKIPVSGSAENETA